MSFVSGFWWNDSDDSDDEQVTQTTTTANSGQNFIWDFFASAAANLNIFNRNIHTYPDPQDYEHPEADLQNFLRSPIDPTDDIDDPYNQNNQDSDQNNVDEDTDNDGNLGEAGLITPEEEGDARGGFLDMIQSWLPMLLIGGMGIAGNGESSMMPMLMMMMMMKGGMFGAGSN
jgi:hypothetical protein